MTEDLLYQKIKVNIKKIMQPVFANMCCIWFQTTEYDSNS